jgi:pilus assembly protein CpaD
VLLAGGCYSDRTITGSSPRDYRERHPIQFTEGERSIQLLVGSGRGTLTPDQRAQVSAFAGDWRREASSRIVIDTPAGAPNELAAKHVAREVQSMLKAHGVPARAIATRAYQPPRHGDFGPVRIAYARIEAKAGPCGAWPEDMGASLYPSLEMTPANIDNRPYWNFGCGTQRNLAAAVANPEDLVQPRAETPPYAARRQQVVDKYRQGQDPSSSYTKSTDAKVSDVGK